MQAIETLYKGYRFRSRLEARWAVFFDTINLLYEYEKEGYDLVKVGRYLPDFWVPTLKCWIEIKGGQPTQEEVEKGWALMHYTGNPVLIFSGLPSPETPGVGVWTEAGESSGGDAEGQVWWDICIRCKQLRIRFETPHSVVDKAWESIMPICSATNGPCFLIQDCAHLLLPACDLCAVAVDASRSARFEYGENGSTVRTHQ